MLISSGSLVLSNFINAPLRSFSTVPSTRFADLLESREVSVEPYQTSALSFYALGMFGNFESVNFIALPTSVEAPQASNNAPPNDQQATHKKCEFKQNLSGAETKMRVSADGYILPYLPNNHQKNLTNLVSQAQHNVNIIGKNVFNTSEKLEINFKESKITNIRRAYERKLDPLQVHASQSGGQTIISLTGTIFDLTKSLKMRDISSKILAEFGIKNSVLYINANNVTKACYSIREENHGSGAR